ncbi:MAG: hypothetical protein HXK72_01325 [Clostridiales bacterium]|nr:hypothetical protein [Clostridiales bacterium]
MIEELKKINEKLLLKNDNNIKEKEKYLIIKKILNKEKAFLKMNIEYAYGILRDLNVPEESIKNIYFQLLDEAENN